MYLCRKGEGRKALNENDTVIGKRRRRRGGGGINVNGGAYRSASVLICWHRHSGGGAANRRYGWRSAQLCKRRMCAAKAAA